MRFWPPSTSAWKFLNSEKILPNRFQIAIWYLVGLALMLLKIFFVNFHFWSIFWLSVGVLGQTDRSSKINHPKHPHAHDTRQHIRGSPSNRLHPWQRDRSFTKASTQVHPATIAKLSSSHQVCNGMCNNWLGDKHQLQGYIPNPHQATYPNPS